MKITVTQKHIERGVPGQAAHCPIAIAINEQCPAYEASVYGIITGIKLSPLLGGNNIRVPMTYRAMQFVTQFDTGNLKRRWWKPDEYVFDIPIPESCVTGNDPRTSVPSAPESVTASY